MPDYLFTYESVGVHNKYVLTRKAKPIGMLISWKEKIPMKVDKNEYLEIVAQIQYLLKNSTCTCAEIAEYFHFKTSTVKAINSGKNHYSKDIHYPIRNFRGIKNSQSVEAILAKRSTETIDTSSEM